MTKDPFEIDGKRRPAAHTRKDPKAAADAAAKVTRSKEPPRSRPPHEGSASKLVEEIARLKQAAVTADQRAAKAQQRADDAEASATAEQDARRQAEQLARAAEERARAAERRTAQAAAKVRKTAPRRTAKRKPRGAVHEELHQIALRLPPAVMDKLEATVAAYGLDRTAGIRVAITEWYVQARAKGLIPENDEGGGR